MEEHHSDRTYRFFNKTIHKVGKRLREVSLPGFQGVAIYDVIWFFINGIQQGALNTRASSISFNFLLALGPALIFLLSLIPFLPVENFKEEFLDVVEGIIPMNSYEIIKIQIEALFQQRFGLTSFGLLTSLFFAQKGIHGITEAFNATHHTIETRTWYKQRLASIGLVFIFYILVIVAFILIVYNKLFLQHLVNLNIIEMNLRYYLLNSAKWIILVLLTFCSISTMYYFGTSRRTKWSFFSAGSSLATILAVITSICFTYFMNHFAQLNKFFGSIGAIMALMLWMNFNALTLLIGFELNASINRAQKKRR
ncbi:MAG: YihY/virulence factor BrkB family protein [Bacteroidales bacterium]|nr:YihY/virulence factor BrkB family protein [Bacteroidales bacterium]